MKFSIIVVCLNPGEKLEQTLESILKQTYTDFEIVIKDGGSRDGSICRVPRDERIRLYTEQDKSIYDAMNQAVSHARGEVILFMNCGDLFYSEDVLENTAKCMETYSNVENMVFYGDTYGAKNHVLISAPPEINGFTCYRNIPCHQACFYGASLCKEKPFDLQYRIRADYDHFLWCYYVAGAGMVNMKQTVASYEGGGYSENKENRRRDKQEHKMITTSYMSRSELWKYRMIMWGTLAPLRSLLAESRAFAGIYHWAKKTLYK